MMSGRRIISLTIQWLCANIESIVGNGQADALRQSKKPKLGGLSRSLPLGRRLQRVQETGNQRYKVLDDKWFDRIGELATKQEYELREKCFENSTLIVEYNLPISQLLLNFI